MAGPLSTQMSGLTDPGAVRENNEDTIRWDGDGGWAVLADGMGGHLAGEVASALAGDLLQQYFNALPPEGNDSEVAQGLGQAVAEANRLIHHRAGTDPRCHNMGTTVVAALFRGSTLSCAHVGDSRLYRYRGGELEQLSHDHSLVQELVDEGMMSREEAIESTHKNVITRALGLAAEVEVDLLQAPLEAGDLYLLCSDGLSDKLPDAELAGLLQGGSLDEMAQRLVAEAKARGGEDNISLILVKVE
jgi:protein phosphatase